MVDGRLTVARMMAKQGAAAAVRDNLRNDLTAMFRAPDYAANESFVDLHSAAKPADGLVAVNVCHMLANERSHAPCRLVGDAELALQFLAADTVSRGGEQMDCIKPQLQRRPGLRERGANSRVQMVTAPLARIGALGLDPIPLGRALARRAGKALPKADVEQVRKAGFVVRELAKKLRGGEGLCVHALAFASLFYVCKGDKRPSSP